MSGEAIDPQTQTFLHILKVRKQEGLMRAEGNRILGVEGRETTREITNIEEDISPDLDLKETGVSRLATPDEVEFLTLP